MNILQDQEKDFKYTALAVTLFFAAFSLSIIYVSFTHSFTTERIVISSLSFSVSLGLFFKYNAALIASQFILFLVILIAVIGYINPFTVGDMLAAGKEPPPVWYMALKISPIIITSLWCLHILGKYKSKFRKVYES